MFSQVSVCPRGVGISGPMSFPDVWGEGTPPRNETSGGMSEVSPHMGYGRQAGGTHPTGMLSG